MTTMSTDFHQKPWNPTPKNQEVKPMKPDFENRYQSLKVDLLNFLNSEIDKIGVRKVCIESGSNKTILKIRNRDETLHIDTLLKIKEKIEKIPA